LCPHRSLLRQRYRAAYDHFDLLCPKKHAKGYGKALNQMEKKCLLGLDYADDLRIPDENFSIMNDFFFFFEKSGCKN
jgi:hypothetical protein